MSPTPQTTSITVFKASDPVPEVTVEGPLGGSVFAKDSFSINAIAQVFVDVFTYNLQCSNIKQPTLEFVVNLEECDENSNNNSILIVYLHSMDIPRI